MVEEAEICRGTFYAHYRDIDDLFDRMKSDAVSVILGFVGDTGVVGFLEDPRPVVTFCLQFVERDREYYKNLLLNESAAAISGDIIELCRDGFISQITAAYPHKSQAETRCFLVFAASGVQGLVVRWLKNELTLDTPTLTTMLCNMIGACKFAFLNETLFLQRTK